MIVAVMEICLQLLFIIIALYFVININKYVEKNVYNYYGCLVVLYSMI